MMTNNGIRFVYLAGPIDLDPTSHKSDWRKEAAEMLEAEGICSFLPSEAFVWTGGVPGYEKVIRINTAALEQADAVLFHLNSRVTIGTVREIQVAADRNIPSILWIDADCWDKYSKSLYLAGLRVEHTLDQAVKTLLNTELHLLRPRE